MPRILLHIATNSFMKSIELPGTRLSVSRFVFGTGSLHHLGGLQDQVTHLQVAADAGFCHFDTAPLYGFTQAEKALGLAFGSNSSHPIGVTTKVGLYPPIGASRSRLAMLASKTVGKFIPTLSKPEADWAVERARRSLDNSLKRLQREHVDLLLLHEPDHRLVETDEWLEWLEHETANRVSYFGICGETSRIAPFLKADSPLTQVIQAPDSVEGKEADLLLSKGRLPQLTYGYLSSNFVDESAENILRGALARNRSGAVVVSTRSRARLKRIAELAEAEGRG